MRHYLQDQLQISFRARILVFFSKRQDLLSKPLLLTMARGPLVLAFNVFGSASIPD
jgi:hypothetical protein